MFWMCPIPRRAGSTHIPSKQHYNLDGRAADSANISTPAMIRFTEIE